MNCVMEIARKDGRDYITPEDVTDAFKDNEVEVVRLAVLEVLGNKMGAEDSSCCAFVAWRGKVDEVDS